MTNCANARLPAVRPEKNMTTPEIAAEETSPQPAGYPAAGGDDAFTHCSSIVPPFWLSNHVPPFTHITAYAACENR